MEVNFFSFFFLVSSVGVVSNVVTLVGIVRNFNIRVHVFLLLFLDALISALGCGASAVLHALVLVGGINAPDHAYCLVAFLTFLVPTNSGTVLCLLISSSRLFLTVKAAKNEKPSRTKVTFCSLTIFVVVVLTNLTYITINELLDVPYAIHIEACVSTDKEPRYHRHCNRLSPSNDPPNYIW